MSSIEETLRRMVREEVRAALAEWQPPPPLALTPQDERLLTIDDLAEWLQVAPETVRDWRVDRKDPPALKLGTAVRYRRVDVEKWLASRAAGGR